jgi:hypothetical protein
MNQNEPNKDQGLKLRIRRILWAQGYHCPVEVDLSHFEYEDSTADLKRSSFTDIDVLAIKFEPDLRRRVVVADCKSGHESEPSRLFWLKGVMAFFGAHEALLVKPSVRSPARALAPRLGLRIVDSKALEMLEQAIKVETTPQSFIDSSLDDLARSLWGITVKANSKPTDSQLRIKRTYQYLQYLYWMIDDYRNIQTIIDRFSDVAKDLEFKEKPAKYLCYIGLQRFALSLLNMASEVAARDVGSIERQCKIYLFGGSLALRERETTFTLLNRLASQRGLFPRKEQITLEPPYFRELIEIVNRLILNSGESSKILQHLDAVLLECILQEKTDVQATLGALFRTDALVLSKRIATLLQKAAGLPADTFAQLLAL